MIAVNIETGGVVRDVGDLAPWGGGVVNVYNFGGIDCELVLHAMGIDREGILRSDGQGDKWEVTLTHRNRRREPVAENGNILVGVITQLMEIGVTVQVVRSARLVRAVLTKALVEERAVVRPPGDGAELDPIDVLAKFLARGGVKYVQDGVLGSAGRDSDGNELSVGGWRVVIDRVMHSVGCERFWIEQEALCRVGSVP